MKNSTNIQDAIQQATQILGVDFINSYFTSHDISSINDMSFEEARTALDDLDFMSDDFQN